MQYKIIDESPWQILSNAMTIGPSSTGYQLQVAADGRNYTTLFTVGAGITRQITNLSSGSYFRMKGNVGEVTVNWVRDCSGGGGGGNAGELEPVTDFPVGVPEGTVVALASGDTVGVYQYDGTEWVSVGGDLSDYYTKAETDAEISAATSPIQEQLDDVERVTATALTELHDTILEISGSTGSGPIIPAITSQADYEAISGDVQTGDLIQVYGVDINGDGEEENGLFEASVEQDSISWGRKDNAESLSWADENIPWMIENDVHPIEFLGNDFFVSFDLTAEDEAYNGIGFDADGKPVITHIVPHTDEQTGEITGITREDTPIGPDQAKEQVIATALVDLDQRKVESQDVHTIVKLTQTQYDDIVSPDPDTLYIIINQ